MSPPVLSLLAFAAWGTVLIGAIEIWRAQLMASGAFRIEQFTAGVAHGPAAYWRLNRAHLNLLETAPIFAIVVLAAEFSGYRSGLFSLLAVVIVGARVLQSLCHVASGAPVAVQLRALAFLVQLGAIAAMTAMLLAAHADTTIQELVSDATFGST